MNTHNKPSFIIKPFYRWWQIDLKELWQYRDLLYFLIWREIKLRYKQTLLGISWVIIQPFLLMVVFTLFFGKLTKLPSEGIPYPLFTYSALLPWMLFLEGLNRSINTITQDTSLIRKVYFPRLLMPLSAVISPLVDFGISLIIFLGLMLYYGCLPSLRILWLPVFVIFCLFISLGCGLWFSAINVQYRDVRYAMPFIVQLWFFASPIVYPTALLPDSWKFIYNLNPLVGVIEGFRWMLLGMESKFFNWGLWIGITLFILVSGIFFFHYMEKSFADIV